MKYNSENKLFTIIDRQINPKYKNQSCPTKTEVTKSDSTVISKVSNFFIRRNK